MLYLEINRYPYRTPRVNENMKVSLVKTCGDIVIDFNSLTISGSMARLKHISSNVGLAMVDGLIAIDDYYKLNPKKLINKIIDVFYSKAC